MWESLKSSFLIKKAYLAVLLGIYWRNTLQWFQFDMMEFSSQVIEENKYVQESYGENSQKSYVLSFLLRVRVYRTIQIIMQKILIKNHSLMQRLLKLIIQMKLLNLKFHWFFQSLQLIQHLFWRNQSIRLVLLFLDL